MSTVSEREAQPAGELDLDVGRGVGLGRRVETQAAVEGERGGHVGDDELDDGDGNVSNALAALSRGAKPS